MQFLFVSIYRFFSRKKPLLWLAFILSLSFWIACSLRIKLKEDIADMLPDSKALRAMNDVVSKTQAGEQLIFIASFTDTNHVDQDSLISAVNNYGTALKAKAHDGIDTLKLETGAGFEEGLAEIVQDNLPLFLTKQDIAQLDSLLTPERIEKTLANNRRILLSPASVVYKQIVAKDPVGISGLVWSKLKALQFDPNYEIYDNYLFSNDQKHITFFLKPKYKASETGKNSALLKNLEVLSKQWAQKHPEIHITYFGGPAVAEGNASQMRMDTILTLSITVVLLLALTFYFFRRKRTALLLLVPVVYGATMGAGVMYLVQGTISVIALGAGAIVLGIAIDFSIHFLAHARHAASMEETIKELAQPLTIGSFTTIAAFFSLRFVHTPILQDLGLFAAMSLLGAALCTLVFLPHFTTIRAEDKPRTTFFDTIAKARPEKSKWLVAGIFLLTPVMLYFGRHVEFDSDLMHLNYLSPEMEQAQAEVSKANAYALSSVFLVADENDEEKALQQLEAIGPVLSNLADSGWIRSTSNPILLLPSNQEQQRRINAWNGFWSNERKQNILASLDRAAVQSGFSKEIVNSFAAMIDADYTVMDSDERAFIKTIYPGGFATSNNNHYAIAALKVPQEHRQQVFNALEKQNDVVVTDRQQGATQLVSILSNDFTNIAVYSSLIVFFALLIGYGRIELAIIAFLPMAISWIWILGLMSLLGLQFNIVNIIISSLIFGLGDDYTIFTMDGLVEKYKHGKNKLTSVRAAVYLSALTVLIGLGVLLLAKHPALRSIAFISVTGLLCVLFISQTLQPFLFNWFIQHRADKKFLPFTLRTFLISLFAFAYFFTGSMVLTVLGVFFTRLWPFNKNKGKYYFHAWVSRYTWSMMYIMYNQKKRIYNIGNEDFRKPAVYVANHSSFLDILITTMLNPKLVLMTNKWVWRSPVFGAVVRMAEYYPVADGAEDSIEPLRDLVERGYSIVVFPEGTRSYDDKIKRFHKGAFYIAEQLGLDVVPLLLHGVHYTMQKGDFLLKDGTCSIYIHPRIPLTAKEYGTTYSERTKSINKWMRRELDAVKTINESPKYFKEQLIRSYTYKGPVLEWYCKIKIGLENFYEQFHTLLPRKGKFYDLGCGYGFMTYMLHWAAPQRNFIGVDYDEEKIATAQGNFLRDDTIRFEQGDVTRFQLQPCDGIIISDVLHYLTPKQQFDLLERSVAALNNNGKLIIRDGVAEMKQRIKGTKLTELFSTRIFKFNKTQNDLHYISQADIVDFAAKHNLKLEVLDNTKLTANVVFVFTKP